MNEPFLYFSLGLALGLLSFFLYNTKKMGGYKALGLKIIQEAEQNIQKIKQESEFERKQKLLEVQRQIEENQLEALSKIQKAEMKLNQKEEKLEAKTHLLEKKIGQIEKHEATLQEAKEQTDAKAKYLQEKELSLMAQLEKTAGLTAFEAKEQLLKHLEGEILTESASYIRKIKQEAEEGADRAAKNIIATAINRLEYPFISESTINTVSVPTEEMKGRIIGKEGRNIRTLERATGVTFIVDDTPKTIVLSAFDPLRLRIAKEALTELIQDGRIHPTRIEEVVEKTKGHIEKKIIEYGEEAAFGAGQLNLHPEIIQLLGKLKFRYSYGQNVLDHSLEVSHLMGMIASELQLDVQLAKRIGLLHDMGKAVSHEIQGTHALIGHDLALKYGESEEVAVGIGCHHYEMEPTTLEASFCATADKISASRPGARIEAVSEYIKRIKKLEEIALEFKGVDRAYAMQAGRELCIAVLPDMIDDSGTIHLARELTKRIEKELHYTGKIKVTVIREKRTVAYAL